MNNDSYRMYTQAYNVYKSQQLYSGDIIQPFNETVITSGISPTITTRPEGFKTAIIVVVDKNK